MGKMKAIIVDPDAPGRLSMQMVDEPSVLATNEALIRVAATSLNLGELHVAQSAAAAGLRLGWDVAGTVERAAVDGSGPPVGARVVGLLRSGAWAEWVAVPTNALAELPAGVSFAQAATLPVAGLTALYAIERGSGLLGRGVLVTGASGGVGHLACQIARLSGAKVVGLVRQERNKDLVQGMGARVVVSEDGATAQEFGPYRLIVETVGGPVLANALGMLAPDGTCVSIGAAAGSWDVTFNAWELVRGERGSLYGFLVFNELNREPASVGLARLASLVAEERLRPHITIEASWQEIGQVAWDLLERRIPGKAVLNFV
jgi:NADPH:quinone reductase